MAYLLDTHAFLWFVSDPEKLSQTALDLIQNDDNEIYISIASLWEISIKTALGKLVIDGSYESVVEDLVDNAIEILPIAFSHTVEQNGLPFFHRDPFDRIIVSQALIDEMDLISNDPILDQYFVEKAVSRIW